MLNYNNSYICKNAFFWQQILNILYISEDLRRHILEKFGGGCLFYLLKKVLLRHILKLNVTYKKKQKYTLQTANFCYMIVLTKLALESTDNSKLQLK